MDFLVGPDWKTYFDVIIVQARKPRFFTDVSRPVRIYDERSGIHIWDRVIKLQKGVIYYEVLIFTISNETPLNLLNFREQ